MRALFALLVLSGACNTYNPADPDAEPAVPPDANPCMWPFEPAVFFPCVDVPQVSDDLMLTDSGTYTYDTNKFVFEDPTGSFFIYDNAFSIPETAVRAATTAITVNSFELGPNTTLRVIGSRALLITSWSTITINGTIDASSSEPDGRGTGGSSSRCNITESGAYTGSTGGGGAGGSFGASGGEGGRGGDPNAVGGAKGQAAIQSFHGGCRGGNAFFSSGGNGGGAIFLSARSRLTLGGTLLAGGAGGQAGVNFPSGGGGGGGSGGYLGLEAETLILQQSAILAANGGGGGGGATTTADGENGEAGLPSQLAAAGGAAMDAAGSGGDGGRTTMVDGLAGTIAQAGGGGGGGGGSGGYIVFRATSISDDASVVSPAASTTNF